MSNLESLYFEVHVDLDRLVKRNRGLLLYFARVKQVKRHWLYQPEDQHTLFRLK